MKVLTALVLAIAGFGLVSTGSALATPGDIAPLSGSSVCVSEDGTDPAGTPGGCIDGKGLSGGISAMGISPNGKQLHVLGFDAFGGSSGDSITTYDRSSASGSVSADPRPNSCRAAVASTSCSSGGGQASVLQAPNGIAISPNNNQVYVSARRSASITVFDYLENNATVDPAGQLGPLQRKATPNGCVTDAASPACLDARGLSTASDVVMSPDGNTVYTAGRQAQGGGIAVFDRASNGVLTQKAGTAACVNDDGGNGCTDGSHLEPIALAISADGKNLYAASYDPATSQGGPNGPNSSITVFDVSPDGSITQKAGVTGCFTESGSGGACTAVAALNVPVDISITPDGKSVYVATDLPSFLDAPDVAPLVAFDRNTTTGALTRRGCFAAEGALGCTQAAGIYRPLTVTATNEAVYVGSQVRNADQGTGTGAAPGGMEVLKRNPTDGSLSQDANGCFTSQAFGSCVVLPTIGAVRSIAVSPDGDNLYAGSEGVTIFNRDDGVAPDTTINSGPSGSSTSTDASFTFSADKPGVSYECSLDSTDTFTPCTSPKAFSTVSVGQHTFRVRATDAFNQIEAMPAQQAFTVTAPPSCATDASLCPPKDTKVDAKVTFAKLQKQKKGKIAVVVSIKANENIKADISGSVQKGKAKASFRGQIKALAAGTTAKITLKPTKSGQGRLVAAALLGSGRAVPKIILILIDGAQNRLVVKPVLKIQGYKATQGKSGKTK